VKHLMIAVLLTCLPPLAAQGLHLHGSSSLGSAGGRFSVLPPQAEDAATITSAAQAREIPDGCRDILVEAGEQTRQAKLPSDRTYDILRVRGNWREAVPMLVNNQSLRVGLLYVNVDELREEITAAIALMPHATSVWIEAGSLPAGARQSEALWRPLLNVERLTLDLPRNRLVDLSKMSLLHRLESLDLINVTPHATGPFSPPRLRSLRARAESEDARLLLNLPKLEYLMLVVADFGNDEWAAALRRLRGLRHLDLLTTSSVDLRALLSALPSLETASFWLMRDAELLAGAAKDDAPPVFPLRELKISQANVADSLFTFLPALNALEIFEIRSFQSSPAALAGFVRQSRLTALTLWECADHREVWEAVSTLTTLSVLRLTYCAGLTDADLKNIAENSPITEISLHRCGGYSSEGLAGLLGSSSMRSIVVEYDPALDHQVLRSISEHATELERLELRGTRNITTDGIIRILERTIVTELTIHGLPQRDPSAARTIRSTIAALDRPVTLDLR